MSEHSEDIKSDLDETMWAVESSEGVVAFVTAYKTAYELAKRHDGTVMTAAAAQKIIDGRKEDSDV